jgi:glycosyltransferase involved in cell wall biosynthesis
VTVGMTCEIQRGTTAGSKSELNRAKQEVKASICIVSQQAYGSMRGGRSGFVGGIEWQTSLMAKWLAARGHAVSLLVWDEGGPAEEIIDGVRVVKLCRQKQGAPVIRFFYPRWWSLASAMRRVNAEVYYQNGSECTTGQVALWCARHKKPFVFTTASDADCHPDLRELHRQERALYRIGLNRANRVIVQTAAQQKLLRQNFARDSVVIPMPCPEPPAGPPVQRPTPPRVLWIGRICAVKRPLWLLDLASLRPDTPFDVVGPFRGDITESDFRDRASKLPNVTVHGGVPRETTHEFYRRASLLCCTSEYEGFPNTFLEAWSHGVPVVSTFDPDGIIERERLGRTAKTQSEMARTIRETLCSPDVWTGFSENARRYFYEHHRVDSALPRFEKILLEVTAH